MTTVTTAADLAVSAGAFLICITMYARLNELRSDQRSAIWWLRRIAFVSVIGACAMLIAAPLPFVEKVEHWRDISRLALVWGVFLVFFTSPYQKPWWELIVGAHRARPDRPTTRRARLLDEFAVFRRGFKRGSFKEKRVGPPDRRVSGERRNDQSARG